VSRIARSATHTPGFAGKVKPVATGHGGTKEHKMKADDAAAARVAARIADAAQACGISLVASLPDGWITPLIRHFDGDTRFRHVPVNREEAAIGLCSGAFFSGLGALALMGASGFLTCIYAITKVNYTYQIPLLIGITLRGRPGDHARFHQSNALYLDPVIRAIDIPFVEIERGEDIPKLAVAFRHSRVLSRPVVVGFSRDVLRGEA
jgi:sulfopyruvate decarboxylase subunit alpha